ncbi:unnamed protein product [Amaranthus hypochondriacus]
MNGFSNLEEEPRDFVEVDPTGRYGRYNEILGKAASKIVYEHYPSFLGFINKLWRILKMHILGRREGREKEFKDLFKLVTQPKVLVVSLLKSTPPFQNPISKILYHQM